MKIRLLQIYLLACILWGVASCHARSVSVEWDQPDTGEWVVGWRIWSGSTLVATSSVTWATIHIANTEMVLTATAISASGVESAHSAPLIIPPPLLWIQKSANLLTWENVVQIPYAGPDQRLRLDLPPLLVPPSMLWIQKSTGLRPWENVVQIPHVGPHQFVRLEQPPP